MNSHFWNQKCLNPPFRGSFEIKAVNASQISKNLAIILEKIIKVLEDKELLHQEAAILSRLLYRMKRVLFKDKGFKGCQKIIRALRNDNSLNLLSVMVEIRNCTYDKKGPSKEMIEWGLVSFMRFSALFNRIYKLCVDTGCYLHHNNITTGHVWNRALLFQACISRIWIFSKYLLIEALSWFDALKNFRYQLPTKEVWLPEDFELPDSLMSWLRNPEYLKVNKTEGQYFPAEVKDDQNAPSCSGFIFNEDLGEVIPREDESSDPTKVAVVETSPKQEELGLNLIFRNSKDILAFVKKENLNRKYHKKRALTKTLSDSVWFNVSKFLMKQYELLKDTQNKKTFKKLLSEAQELLTSVI